MNFNAAAVRPNGASADRPACRAIGRGGLSPSLAACRSRNGQSTAPVASVGLFRRGCRSLRGSEQFDNRPGPLISSPKRCGQSAVDTEVETEVGASVGWRLGGSRVGARQFDGSSGAPQRLCPYEIENMRHYYCVSTLILLVLKNSIKLSADCLYCLNLIRQPFDPVGARAGGCAFSKLGKKHTMQLF